MLFVVVLGVSCNVCKTAEDEEYLVKTNFTDGDFTYELQIGSKEFHILMKDETCPTGKLEIPSKVTINDNCRDIPVTGVWEGGYSGGNWWSAFLECEKLNSVTFPESLTSIGSWAFWYCSGLTSVTFPGSLTSIEQRAFGYCSGLTSVTFPASLTSIASWAFGSCTLLKYVGFCGTSEPSVESNVFSLSPEVYVPNDYSGTSFGGVKTVIKDDSSLDCVQFEPSGVCRSGDDENFTDGTEFEADLGNGKVNYKLVNSGREFSVEKGEMCPTGLVTIPETHSVSLDCNLIAVTSVGDGSFEECAQITEVKFDGNVVSIGQSAFKGCLMLSLITFPGSLKSIGDSAFYNCARLASAALPSSVNAIGEYAFSQCHFTSFTFSVGVTGLSNSVLADCFLLESVTIDGTVESYGENCFAGCGNLVRFVYLGKTNPVGNSDPFGSGVTSIDIITTGEGERVFCHDLSQYGSAYRLRDSVLTVRTSGEKYVSASLTSTVRSIGNVEEVVLQEGVYGVEDYAFDNWDHLTKLSLHVGLKVIGTRAFGNCGFTELEFPVGLKEIGNSAFESCTSLVKVVLAEHSSPMGGSAFKNCVSLTQVVYCGDSLIELVSGGSDPFEGCDQVKIDVASSYPGETFAGSAKSVSVNDAVCASSSSSSPDADDTDSGLSVGGIVAIVLGVLALVVVIVVVVVIIVIRRSGRSSHGAGQEEMDDSADMNCVTREL